MAFNQQNKWGRMRQLTIWVVIVVLLIVAQPFLWRFVYASAARLQAARTAEEQSTALKSRVSIISAELQNAQPLIGQLPLSFLGPNDTPQAVERLEQSAARHNVTLQIITIEEKPPETVRGQADVVPLSIHVRASGTPAQLMAYIDLMEHAPEVTSIPSWTLAAAPTTQVDLNAQPYSLDMVVYFYLLKEL